MNYFVCKFDLNKATGKIITGNWERVKRQDSTLLSIFEAKDWVTSNIK